MTTATAIFPNPLRWALGLWRDQKHRGTIIQIMALVALLLFIGIIIRNTAINLQALGLEIGYDFLTEPANYDINQHLIDYNSLSSHLRATAVGVINTALVSVCGIILATVIGLFAGILRLSKNWLVNRIMYAYVEFGRNVPVLLQILLFHALIIHTLPHPRASLSPMDGVFLSNRGFYVPQPVLEPAAWAILAALVIAAAVAWWFAGHAKRVQENTGRHYPVFTINAALIIGLPLLAFFLAGRPIGLDFPQLKGFNYQGGMVLRPEFTALWFALSFYAGAYIAELVRAGILAINRGQTEAAYSLGLKPNWTMRLVILPQAMRVMVPPLISQYLGLIKDSSLAIVIGYMDIVATIGGISLNQTGRALECMSITLFIYLSISLGVSTVMNWSNRRVSLVER